MNLMRLISWPSSTSHVAPPALREAGDKRKLLILTFAQTALNMCRNLFPVDFQKADSGWRDLVLSHANQLIASGCLSSVNCIRPICRAFLGCTTLTTAKVLPKVNELGSTQSIGLRPRSSPGRSRAKNPTIVKAENVIHMSKVFSSAASCAKIRDWQIKTLSKGSGIGAR